MGEPNNALAALIKEADERSGCSWAGLARRVNDLGADEGYALRYDYTAVHRWVKRGEYPRSPVPNLIAQTLSEKLGRCINPTDFGMTDEQSLAARALNYSTTPSAAVDTIVELGRADMKRRKVIKAPFVLAALAAPSRDWLLATLEETSDERGPRKVGMRQIAGIREMFALFQEMDVMRGGGHARTALVEYIDSYVMPLVKRDHGSEEIQRALYEVAAEQVYLVGWMAYDDGQHGLAQRYLIQSLRLAQASGKSILGAHVLAGMSDQANLLGHPREALMLARAGRRGITLGDSPACLADLHILEGRALARLGETRAAVDAVVKAERTMQFVVPENEPEWARFIDVAYVFGEAGHCFRDLGQSAEIDRFASESAAVAQQQGRARRSALSHTALAISQLNQGGVEAAAATGVLVVDLASSVNSSRCIEAVHDLQRRLRPYSIPEVQHFNTYTRDHLGIAL